jgi:hypothetical protein
MATERMILLINEKVEDGLKDVKLELNWEKGMGPSSIENWEVGGRNSNTEELSSMDFPLEIQNKEVLLACKQG